MIDYQAFRNQARAAFPDLIISVMIYEKGSGIGGEVTMFRLSAQGQPIGAATLTATTDSAQDTIKSLIRQVGPARRQVREQREANRRTRHQLAQAA